MVFDNEEQRQIILQCINSTPVQGPLGELIGFAQKASVVRDAVLSATIYTDPAQEMMASR